MNISTMKRGKHITQQKLLRKINIFTYWKIALILVSRYMIPTTMDRALFALRSNGPFLISDQDTPTGPLKELENSQQTYGLLASSSEKLASKATT